MITPKTVASAQKAKWANPNLSVDHSQGAFSSHQKSGKALFINMSNPNPQPGDLPYARMTNAQMMETNRKNGITIAGFPGVWENGVHQRFGKRIDFDGQVPGMREIGSEYLKEIQDKMVRTERDFTNQREQEKEFIKGVRDQIAGERRRKYELLMRKRDEFVRDNTQQSIEKRDKKDRDRKEFLDYRPNFFPFTYGEEVESKRAKLRENLKKDLNRLIQASSTKLKPSW